MPEIQAFRGLRYDLGHVGALGDVVAPPYDVIDADRQDALYKRHPANVIRLILNRPEPGDDDANNRYTRAARFLRNWRSEGVLRVDGNASIYVYYQSFRAGDRELTRRGFMARVRIEPFGSGRVFPHEETLASPKADRLKLTQACKTNLSPIFGLYPDPQRRAEQLLDDAIGGAPPLEAVDHLGVVHRMWPVADVHRIAGLSQLVGDKPLFIADGHHRYETALNYRDTLAAQRPLDRIHPANFVLTMLVSMSDSGMVVLPTHRLFRGLPPIGVEELRNRLSPCFAPVGTAEGPEGGRSLWEAIEADGVQGELALYSGLDRRWLRVRITREGERRMAEVASEHGDAWRGLGVAILHRLVIERLFETRDVPRPEYVHQVDEVVAGLRDGDPSTGSHYSLAALVMPATIEHIRSVSVAGERMPAKSTYFYPKLLSGLVLHSLEP
ncbi:MAG: DUF1015 domain-containing protein [Planctomycetes bacterium]|nr:DUF1015 domain-containing protein [Planctomycetota bacterium]